MNDILRRHDLRKAKTGIYGSERMGPLSSGPAQEACGEEGQGLLEGEPAEAELDWEKTSS
jgi:hypothetical protein